MRVVLLLIGMLMGGGLATWLDWGAALVVLGMVIGSLAGWAVATFFRGGHSATAATASGLTNDENP